MIFDDYQKIATIYERDPETKALKKGEYYGPLANYLKYLENLIWIWTEKIDGTNTGINWDGHSISYQGRTEAAEFTPLMKDYLDSLFAGEDMAQIFEQKFGEKKVTIYGELYGRDIQKVGHLYSETYRFIVFDVKINGFYLARKNVEDVASYFGLDIVPIVGQGTLNEAVEFVLHNPDSFVNPKAPLEGIVARPMVDVYTNKGERVMVKIKRRDFGIIILKKNVRYLSAETGQYVDIKTDDGRYYFVRVDDLGPEMGDERYLKSLYVNEYDENGNWNKKSKRLGSFILTFD